MVQEKADTLGNVIKNARMEANITMETLAERIGITERYLYRIENEGKKPSYKMSRTFVFPPSFHRHAAHGRGVRLLLPAQRIQLFQRPVR